MPIPNMMPQRILVTGATGFIGARVAERLLARGHRLALLLRNAQTHHRAAAIYKECVIVSGDLANPRGYSAGLSDFRPQTVIHAAWHGAGGADRNEFAQIRNVDATAWLLELAAVAGARTFIGLGSQAEYGPQNRKLDEQAPTEPTTLYGHSKLAACGVTEAMCRMKELRYAWLRIFSTYGPRDNPAWMMPSLISALSAGRTPALTYAEQKWDFLYVDDAADAVVAVAESSSASGIFNLGSGEAPPLRDTITLIRDLVSPNAVLGFGQVPYRRDQVMHLEADIGRLTHLTGWTPRVPLSAGLKRTADWFAASCGAAR